MRGNPLMPPMIPKESLVIWRGYRRARSKKDELFNQAVLLANSELIASKQMGSVNLILESCVTAVLKSYFYGCQE